MATKKSDAKTPKPQPKPRAPAKPKPAAATATPAPVADVVVPPAPPATLKPDFVPNSPSEPFIPNTTRHARLLINALEWASSDHGVVYSHGFRDSLLRHALGPEIDRVPGEARVSLVFSRSAPRGLTMIQQIAGSGTAVHLTGQAAAGLDIAGATPSWCIKFDTWLFTPGAELPTWIEFAIEEDGTRGVLRALVPTGGQEAEDLPLSYARQISSALIHILAGGGKLQGFESESTIALLRQVDVLRDL